MLGIIEADSHKGVARIFEDGSYYFVSERNGVLFRPETMAVGDTFVYWYEYLRDCYISTTGCIGIDKDYIDGDSRGFAGWIIPTTRSPGLWAMAVHEPTGRIWGVTRDDEGLYLIKPDGPKRPNTNELLSVQLATRVLPDCGAVQVRLTVVSDVLLLLRAVGTDGNTYSRVITNDGPGSWIVDTRKATVIPDIARDALMETVYGSEGSLGILKNYPMDNQGETWAAFGASSVLQMAYEPGDDKMWAVIQNSTGKYLWVSGNGPTPANARVTRVNYPIQMLAARPKWAEKVWALPVNNAAYDWTANSMEIPQGLGSSFSFIFQARAEHDVFVGMSATRATADPMMEVLVGGWANTWSVIRWQNFNNIVAAMLQANNVVSKGEWREYYINVHGTFVEVGFARGSPILKADHHGGVPLPRYLCLGSFNTPVWFRRPEFTRLWSLDASFVSYNWDANAIEVPSYGKNKLFFSFEAMATNDIILAVSSKKGTDGPLFEVVIGGWANTKLAIRTETTGELRAQVSLPGSQLCNCTGSPCMPVYNKFWIAVIKSTKGGSGYTGQRIDVGRDGSDTPLLSYTTRPSVFDPAYICFTTYDSPVQYRRFETQDINLSPRFPSYF
eukprot:m51a1_g5155 hypothetical protein (614) ;mRNA; r:88029-89870